MKFATVINCMDGRTQLPAIAYMQEKFGAKFIDSVTEPGPILILAENQPTDLVKSILNRVSISVNAHGSQAIGIVAHFDCAGNPVPYETQVTQLERAISFIKKNFEKIQVVGIWIDGDHKVHELTFD